MAYDRFSHGMAHIIFQLLNSESVADHPSGVILVGDLGTGKTAIIEQLVAQSCFGDGRGGIVKGWLCFFLEH